MTDAPMSIKDRIAALEKGKSNGSTIPIGPAPTKSKKSNALSDRIAALQMQTVDPKDSGDKSDDNANKSAGDTKVGKLKLPPGGVQLILPGAGPPPSLLKKQKEREERKQKMIEDAQKEDAERAETTATNPNKLKLPPGAIRVIVPGCPPPSMISKMGGDAVEASDQNTTAATGDDALTSRPTMPKRRPRNSS